MSTAKLRWIIGMMSIALIGLIAFQWYWVDTLISSNEDRFQKEVMGALRDVVQKLERQEVMYYVNQHIQPVGPVNQVHRTTSVKPKIIKEKDGTTTYVYHSDSSDIVNFSFSISGNMAEDVVINTEQGMTYQDATPHRIERSETRMTREQMRLAQRAQAEDPGQKVTNKTEMLWTVLEEMIVPKKRLINRYNPEQLDSLLEAEFKTRGISIPYEYAIVKPLSNRLVSITNANQQREILQTGFRVNMFPNDLTGEPSLLLVEFPGEEAYLRDQIWLTMSSSGVLILIILVCFGYAVYTIVRQKNLSEMKTDFINNMTHELKTPIATIGLAIEALQDKDIVQATTMRSRYLNMIGDENKRLGSQVEKVLQMAMIDRKELKLNLKSIDMHELIGRGIEKIGIQLENREGQLKKVFDAQHYTVNGDEIHLMNVILNLLDNAIKYSYDAPNIFIRTYASRGSFVMSIKDHGIGMSKDAQRHVFQRFYRVPTGDLHNVKGFGLGLAYVKSIVEELHGSIEVESDPGQGTIFIIKLPLKDG